EDAATVVDADDADVFALLEFLDRVLEGRPQHGAGVDDQLRAIVHRAALFDLGEPLLFQVRRPLVTGAQVTHEVQGVVALRRALGQGDLHAGLHRLKLFKLYDFELGVRMSDGIPDDAGVHAAELDAVEDLVDVAEVARIAFGDGVPTA